VKNYRSTSFSFKVISLLLLFTLLFSATGCEEVITAMIEAAETIEAEDTSAIEEETAAVEEEEQPTATPRPTRTPKPKATVDSGSASSSKQDTWLFLMYEDADDEILEEDMFFDLNEAERVGSTDQVFIVAQMDRYRGGFKGGGNWTTAKRFLLTQDDDLKSLNSEELADLGEVNMSDPNTLVDFVTWALENYPADHVALILSDHGAGWPGGLNDPAPSSVKLENTPLAEGFGNMLYTHQLAKALKGIQKALGGKKLDLLGFDACLMAQLEVFDMVAPYAEVAVASEEVEPALGWAYQGFLSKLVKDPGMSGAELGKAIVESYIKGDQRLVDDDARAEYVDKYYSRSLSAADVIKVESREVTLSAVDLTRIDSVMAALNNLAQALSETSQTKVAKARTYAQAFQSVWSDSQPNPYLDLGHFAQMLKESVSSTRVSQAADQLIAAIDSTVIAEKHGPKRPGASGISIYFPNSRIFNSAPGGYRSYVYTVPAFAQDSLWDDFLTFHYSDGLPFAESGNGPKANGKTRSPGKMELKISPITVSADTISAGETTTLEADIEGSGIAYLYLFVGYLDTDANAIQVVDMDFLDPGAVQEMDGVIYPDFGEDPQLPIGFEWQPGFYALTTGGQSGITLFSPEDFGSDEADATYSLDGIYTSQDDGVRRYARLFFSGGMLVSALGFAGEDDSGAAREFVPQAGDSFTVLEEWIDLNAADEDAYQTLEGATFVIGEDGLTWQDASAPTGDYVVGFIVEDFDGNTYEAYTLITIK